MFTCISCRVAFESADEQRGHFATDWHRYNMKRRVASLPPVAAASFNEKVMERREQNAVRIDPRDLFCGPCSKSFSSENAYRTHVQSKKHREREATLRDEPQTATFAVPLSETTSREPTSGTSSNRGKITEEEEDEEDEDEDDEEGIEARISAARRGIRPSDCLFCTSKSSDVKANVAHMASQHSFFIPDQDILVDLTGLLAYLGEKVLIGNLCLFCPNGGKEFADVAAVRRHMIDKYHCKIAYDTDEDRAELADYYSFEVDEEDGSDWEEVEEGDDDVAQRPAALATDGLSLVLPNGRTLGHRSMRVYYSQNLRHPSSIPSRTDLSTLKVDQVRKRLADPSLALVPVAGGQGAFGRGLEVMKARNAGEAKWARQQARSHLDQRKKEAMKTRVGYVHNNQKHFRDPLLQ